jgi:hypothetical protein
MGANGGCSGTGDFECEAIAAVDAYGGSIACGR